MVLNIELFLYTWIEMVWIGVRLNKDLVPQFNDSVII